MIHWLIFKYSGKYLRQGLFCRKKYGQAMAKAPQKAETTDLDSIDLAILRLLQQNARITIKEIADKVHLSTSPVHERIRRLEQTGVIKQYVTLLNGAKVKKGLMVICYLSLRQHSKAAGDRFIKTIMQM